MAPSLDVQIRDLVSMTKNLVEVADTFAGIKGFVAGTHIARVNWPQAAWDVADAYKKASSTAEDATDAVRGASDSTASSLDSVARHYAGAEYHSSIRHGSPAKPPAGANYGSGLTAGNAARYSIPLSEATIAVALTARLLRARESLRITARPTGLLPAFLLIDAWLIEPNIRESGPFSAARDTWRAIADSNIEPLCDELGRLLPIRTWDGDAATAFNAYMDVIFLPALNELKSLAGSMGDLCDEMAAGMDQFNGLWLRMVLATTIQLLVINLVPLPYRFMFSYGALALFLFNAGRLIVQMKDRFSEMTATATKLAEQAGRLAADCLDASQALENKRNLLNPHFTMVSDNWSGDDWTQNWHYKAAS